MTVQILIGDCRAMLATLPDASVQCCVTSPPYFGLRNYGVDGQIGLEASPDAYVAEMVVVFREVRRVLREDGVCFLNLGDSYAGANGGYSGDDRPSNANSLSRASEGQRAAGQRSKGIGFGYKSKDLLMIPARVALALQADGWWLRSDIIWAKPNPMPESVSDRPTSAHEHVFLLTKSARYFWDAEAVAEATEYPPGCGWDDAKKGSFEGKNGDAAFRAIRSTRNIRNVWTIATQPFSGSHFATMPPDLAERCIKAGTRPGDTVLDPFGGAGTTALVADRLNRNAILIELNPEYAAMANGRVSADAGLFATCSVHEPETVGG